MGEEVPPRNPHRTPVNGGRRVARERRRHCTNEIETELGLAWELIFGATQIMHDALMALGAARDTRVAAM